MIFNTNNIKIAARVLWRDKFNTVLNTLGLTIGIICSVLLGLYVYQEISFDKFHSKKDRIYRTWLYEDYGDGKTFFNSTTPYRFEALFEENFPEVEAAVQYIVRQYPVSSSTTEGSQSFINEKVVYISPEFFTVFDFKILDGNRTNPFTSNYDLLISKDYALKYFGDLDVVGKTLTIKVGEDQMDFTVSALIENIQNTSSIQFDIALSNELFKSFLSERRMNAWTTVDPETYLLIKENSSIQNVEAKTQDVILNLSNGEFERDEYNAGFQVLTDIHLNPEIPLGNVPVNNPKYVYIMAILGLLVLIIACINYATLSVGRSLKRTKEVGMRKVLGAGKSMLTTQYLFESFLISFLSTVFGAVAAIFLIPVFNSLTGVELIYQFSIWHLVIILIIALAIGFASGIYPALVLSNTKIMSMLMNSQSSHSSHTIRRIMVTFQFVITVFLISSTLIVKDQLNYLQSKDLGYAYDASIYVPLFSSEDGNLLTSITSAMNNAEILKNSISSYPEISDVSISSHTFGNQGWASLAFEDKEGTFRRFRILQTDENFLDAYNIEVLDGRSFEAGNGLDERQSIILNEAAVEYFGYDNPIGKKLPGAEFGEHQIIGVVKDFNYASLHHAVEPLIIAQNVLPIYQGVSDGDLVDSVLPKLQFKYSGGSLVRVEEILEEEWEKAFPNRELDFGFIDNLIAQQYEEEARLNKLVTVGTVISLIIASIGLLGLTVLVINSKEKELGIRKIMGASTAQIFRLLVNSFSIQLILGVIISIPVTVWLMKSWLQDFAYRVEIGISVFVLSTLVSIVISVLVISFHSWKAAIVNPILSLRRE